LVDKVFYIPNLSIVCPQPEKIEIKELLGLTCFVAIDEKITQYSVTDGLCKEIMERVFEIAEKLKEVGRFEGKTIKDRYPLKTLQGKKLLFNNEDYFQWSGINPKHKKDLIDYVKDFIYEYGMFNIWHNIENITLITSKDIYNISSRMKDGTILTIDKNMWGLTDINGFHEVEPLIFILEYIASLYMHHTERIDYYSFALDVACHVKYVGDGYNLSFRGSGLRLLIDLAYLHTVADPRKEFKKCECETWFYADKLKEQVWCSRRCKSRFSVRDYRNRVNEEAKKLWKEGVSIKEIEVKTKLREIEINRLIKKIKAEEAQS
jgi:hypothetical protein